MLTFRCWLIPGLVLLTGLSLTAALWWDVKQVDDSHLRAEFESTADRTANILHNRFDDYALIIHGLKGFFEGSEYITTAEFRTYVQALKLDQKKGIQGIGLVKMVPHAEKQQHIAKIQREGFPDYQIKPEGQRERYAPIIQMEPSDGDNNKALGFDILTVPIARNAMERSRDLGKLVITPKLSLIQDKDKPGVYGFVMYLPFYQQHLKLETIADRRAAILGWVDVPFRMNDLMAGLQPALNSDISLEIHDGKPQESMTLMYRSADGGSKTNAIHNLMQTSRSLDVGGRQWTLLMTTTPAFEARLSSLDRSLIVAIAGFALTVTLTFLTRMLVKGQEQARARYQQLFEQAGDGVVVVNKDHRLIDSNPAALAMLGYDYDELRQLSLFDIVTHHEHPRLQVLFNSMQTATPATEEWQYLRKDGSAFTAEVNARSLDNHAYFAVIRDLTERKKAEHRIQRLTQMYKVLSEINQAIIRMNDERELFPLVCRCAVDFSGIKMAWVGQLDVASERIIPVATYGDGVQYLDELTISANADISAGQGPEGTALRENRTIVINDYLADPMTRQWHDRAVHFGWHSAAAMPIQRSGQPFAVLAVYHDQMDSFDREVMQVLNEMAGDISFAFDNFDHETHRQCMEKALAESEARMSIIMDNVGAYIFLKDSEGRYLFANKKVLDLWSKTEEEVIGFGDEQFFDAQSAAQIRENDRQVLIDGQTIAREETNLVTESGNAATYWTVKLPLRRADGTIYALCGISTDITEPKRIAKELQDSQEKLSIFIQYAPASLAMFDQDMRYLAVSHRWMNDYHLSDRNILGESHYDIFPEISDDWKAVHQRGLKGEVIRNEEDLFTRADGTEQWLFWEVRPWHAADGSIGGIVIFSEDITERKEMERSLLAKEQLLSESQRIAHIGSWHVDMATGYIAWSDETYRIHQIGPDSFDHTKEGFMQLLHSEDRPLMQAWLERCCNGEAASVLEFRILLPDGRVRTLESQAVLKYDANNKPLALEGTVQDITERVLAEEQLRLTAKVFESSQEGIVITDASNTIISANPAYAKISGYTLEEAIGKNPRLVSSGQHDKSFYQAVWNAIHNKSFWQGEVINRRKNGDIYPQWLSVSVIRDQSGEITHHIGILSDLTEHKSAQDKIQFLSNFDPLTNLPNKALLRDRTQLALATARRERGKLAFMYLDIDRFNIINDSLGPRVGDQLLRQFSMRISKNLHSDDTLSRLGSDEFNLLLLDTDAEGAAHVAQKLLLILNKPFVIQDQQLNLTASIGIAEFPQDGDTFEQLLQSADAALFRAKQKGRNNFQFFTNQLHERATQILRIENELRQGLERGELLLHYQPQVNTQTLEITGAEALIRWQHPERGLVSPGLFIPIAEESDLIIDIGQWVLNTAVQQLADWQTSGVSVVPIAVNLSVKQFRQNSLYHQVVNALRQYKLEPGLLELELTEGIAMENTEETIKIVEKLHHLGVMLSIDDFGTGYSSLSYLKRFKIDKLKIDQSFIRNLPSDTEDAAIVTAIIKMAKSLGFQTIAEGVETQEQLNFLRENDSDEIQGYFYSKPLPAEQFAALLRHG